MKNRIFLIALLTIAAPAHAMPAFLNDILLLADSPPQITTAYLDKTKYQLGDQMLITAETTDDWGTKKISAEIQTEKGTETTNLILIAGNSRKGTYQGAWKVHDTIGEKEYKTKIIAADLSGQTTEKTLVWTDPTQGHLLSEITIDKHLDMNGYNIAGAGEIFSDTTKAYGVVGQYTTLSGTGVISSYAGTENVFSGLFTGGKGVKVSGDLEVTGRLKVPKLKPCGILGDVDSDDYITIADSRKAARCALGLDTTGCPTPATGDVDGSGGVNIADAMLIYQYTEGSVPSFPACGTCNAPSGGKYGDVNGDNIVNITDSNWIARYTVGTQTLNTQQIERADVNYATGTHAVDIIDALIIAQYSVGSRPALPICQTKPIPCKYGGLNTGDADGDGKITFADALRVGQCTVGSATCGSEADVNGIGGVTIVDALFIAQYVVDIRPTLPACLTQ